LLSKTSGPASRAGTGPLSRVAEDRRAGDREDTSSYEGAKGNLAFVIKAVAVDSRCSGSIKF